MIEYDPMKVALSKSQWEEMGKKAGWFSGEKPSIILDEKWQKYLESQVESRMGSQDVTISLKDGSVFDSYVINGERLICPPSILNVQIKDIKVR